MELAFTENNEEYGIIGLKEKDFYKKIQELDSAEMLHDNLWVATLRTKQGIVAGYFCSFSTGDHEYHLQSNKGTVRIFKTIEAASKIYQDFTYSGGSCITHVYLGLV